jgi:hypothetical protein
VRPKSALSHNEGNSQSESKASGWLFLLSGFPFSGFFGCRIDLGWMTRPVDFRLDQSCFGQARRKYNFPAGVIGFAIAL